jgi:hypothetical protein
MKRKKPAIRRVSAEVATDAARLLRLPRAERSKSTQAEAAASEAGRLMGLRSAAKQDVEEKRRLMRENGAAYRAQFTPTEYRIEMRRRAKMREKNRRTKIEERLASRGQS